jgi:hypothetical protein
MPLIAQRICALLSVSLGVLLGLVVSNSPHHRAAGSALNCSGLTSCSGAYACGGPGVSNGCSMFCDDGTEVVCPPGPPEN